MKSHQLFCSACDREVRVLITPALNEQGQAVLHDSEVVCLDIGSRCTGNMCPLGAAEPNAMVARIVRNGIPLDTLSTVAGALPRLRQRRGNGALRRGSCGVFDLWHGRAVGGGSRRADVGAMVRRPRRTRDRRTRPAAWAARPRLAGKYPASRPVPPAWHHLAGINPGAYLRSQSPIARPRLRDAATDNPMSPRDGADMIRRTLLLALLVPRPVLAQAPKVGKPASDFALAALDRGTTKVRLSQLKGHPVVISFWASWCPPCRRRCPSSPPRTPHIEAPVSKCSR